MRILSVLCLIVTGILVSVIIQCSGRNPVVSQSDTGSDNLWIQQNPLPTSNSLADVQYLSDQEVIAVGLNKTLLRSVDSGKSWSVEEPGFTDSADDLFFLDGRKGWAVGANGMVMSTANGGRTWHRQNSGTTLGLRAAYFLDKDNGWAVGNAGVIIRTTNGGRTWSMQQVSSAYTLCDVLFADQYRGWAVGMSLSTDSGEEFLYSEDGGKSWKQIDAGIPHDLGYDVYSEVGASLYSLARTSDGKINIVGEAQQGTLIGGIRLRSEDDGKSWSYEFTNVPHFAIRMIDELHGWIVGYGGTMFKTSDGGKTWDRPVAASGYTFSSVSFSGFQTGCAVGQIGSIHVTTDGGSTWTKVTQGSRSLMEDIYFVDAHRGWVVGYGGMLRTEDRGKTWFNTGSFANTALSFIDENIGYAGTFQGDVDKSTDGGITWTRIAEKISSRVYDIAFHDTLVGWTCGNESIRKTTDGGKTWYTKWVNNRENLWTITFVDGKHGWSAGGAGIILHSDNAGETWSQQTTNTNTIFQDIFFLDSLTGWAVGSVGTIIVTHNGGVTWEFQSNPGSYANATLSSVRFIDYQHGWVVGAKGLVLHTTDGGQSWVQQTTPTNEALLGVFALDANTVWACGWSGTILKTSAMSE